MEVSLSKQIIFGDEVRERIMEGISITHEAVATTLGSKGRNVSYELNFGTPKVLHDGVSVAKQIVLKDPFANQAAQLLIEAAQNTNNQAGDGTTTATILAYALTSGAIKQIDKRNNPMDIRKGFSIAVAELVKNLHELARPVETLKEMESVATISAADADTGRLIAEAVKEVGRGGIVTVQEGGSETTVEYKEGMEIDRGYIHPYLVTNLDRQEAILDARSTSEQGKEIKLPVYVVVLNESADNPMLVTILKKIYANDTDARVLLIAQDYLPEAMESIVRTKMNGKRLVAIKCPEFGEHQLNLMNDIALITNGVVIGGEGGIKADEVSVSQIGTCDRVVVADNKTTIIGGHAVEDQKAEYLAGLKNKLEIAKSDGQRDKLEARIARLSGGVAIISVGGTSEPEIVERRERVYDAVNATQAAVDEGIVPGGGTALLLAGESLLNLRESVEKRYQAGVDIVISAIHAPFNRLINNSGVANPDVVLAELNKFDKPMVWDVETNKAVDPYEAGIIDPVKVTRTALIHAESIASMLITMECMIAYDRDILPKAAQTAEFHQNRSFNTNT